MKRWQLVISTIIFSFVHIACSTNEETIQGSWQLTTLQANLDGSKLIEIPISGSKPEIDGTAFSYSSQNGQKSGIWVINDNRTSLEVEFDGVLKTYPIVVDTPNEIQFIIESLDLSKSLSIQESKLIVMLNQNLLTSGSSWTSKAASGNNLEIILTLKKQ